MTPQSKLPNVGTTIFTVMSQLAAQHGAINLGQGFPDFEGPQGLYEALERHLRGGKNQYAPMAGVPALRQAIADKVQRLYGAQVDADREITVTSGATEALFSAIQALVHPGDEVIVLDPCYDSYEPAVTMAGGRTVHVPLTPPRFSVDWERVAAALSPRTRLLLLNSPHNPTGAILEEADIAVLLALTRRHPFYILSDEVYEHIVFDGRPHQSVLRHPELYQRSVAVFSFGKTYHVTGWKIGYCVAPPALSVELRKVHQFVTFCTFQAAQWALADFMAEDPGHYLGLPAFYQDKRDAFRRLLDGSPFQLLPVAGAYFQIADYAAISDEDDAAFCRRLTTEAGVAAIPVSAFYEAPPRGARLVRFCFAKQEDTLRRAAARLQAFAAGGRGVRYVP
jgi:methionine aminotransferase